MDRCATCKHWQPLLDPHTVDASTRQTAGQGHLYWKPNSGVCAQARFHTYYDRDSAFDESRMWVQDGSDYFAALITKGDFGCVEHAPKD